MPSPTEVRTGDRVVPNRPQRLVIVLDRLRSAFNVGNIFRLADTCAVERIVTCGYTATPPHPKLVKTARGCAELVPCSHHQSAVEAITELRGQGYTTVAVETVADAPLVWDYHFQLPLAVVFGNEALGIAQETLDCCDACVQLPVFGRKNSLNVGNCAAVVLYTIIRQLSLPP